MPQTKRRVTQRKLGQSIIIGETRIGVHSIAERVVDEQGRIIDPGAVTLEIAGALVTAFPSKHGKATLWTDTPDGIPIYRLDNGEPVELP